MIENSFLKEYSIKLVRLCQYIFKRTISKNKVQLARDAYLCTLCTLRTQSTSSSFNTLNTLSMQPNLAMRNLGHPDDFNE